MAYVVPTVSEFMARFPVFAEADEYLISLLIDEAAGIVDDSWIERDYAPAIMYLVAHLLTMENSESVDSASRGPIVSESFGPMSRSYGKASSAIAADPEFEGTEYGRRYVRMRSRNFPPIIVVG